MSRNEVEEEEEEEGENEKPPKNPADLFTICGTLSDPEFKPTFPVEIVASEAAAVQQAIMSSDVIVYSMAEGEYTVETQDALDYIQQEIFKIFVKNCKRSNFLTDFILKRRAGSAALH